MSLKKEFQRKWIHFGSALIPLAVFWGWIPAQWIVFYFGFFVVTMGSIEFFRLKTNWGNRLFSVFFAHTLRVQEEKKLTAAFYQLIAFFFCFWFVDVKIATLACLFVSISDGVAALVGVRFGKPWVYGKTKIGTAGFFVSSVFLVLVFQSIDWRIGLAGAIIATVVELLPSRYPDNFSIPVCATAIMVAVESLLR